MISRNNRISKSFVAGDPAATDPRAHAPERRPDDNPARWNDHFPPEDLLVDREEFAIGYGNPHFDDVDDSYDDESSASPGPLCGADLRFLRDFILGSAFYVEQLEMYLCDSSDDFWQAREHAYRIITAALIHEYEFGA